MKNVGYYNGTMGPLEEIQVPMLDRVCFYGDGVYDATMTRDGVILFATDHIDRFFNSMRLTGFQPNFTPAELEDELQKVVDAAEARDNFLYWQVTRGTGPRQHEFLPGVAPNLWIYAVPKAYADLSTTVDVITVEDTRFFHCNVKTLNLLPNVLAAQKAAEAGCSEAIFIRPDGFVTETDHSNCHILKDGALITHPADNLILPGIARKHLIGRCKALGIPVYERPFTRSELMGADEVLISASSVFAQRVAHVDGVEVGGKATDLHKRIVDALNEEFDEYISLRRAR